jgi:hypothetical protein
VLVRIPIAAACAFAAACGAGTFAYLDASLDRAKPLGLVTYQRHHAPAAEEEAGRQAQQERPTPVAKPR